MTTTPVLSLPELIESQASKYVTHNDALRLLGAVLVRVLSATTSAQPSAPADGDAYIVPSGATGTDWATFTAGQIAYYSNGGWLAVTPPEGLRTWVVDKGAPARYDASASLWRFGGVSAPASSAGTLDVDVAAGALAAVTLTENVTSLTFANVPAAGLVELALELTQDGTGGRTFAWPGSVKWAGGAAPAVSSGANAKDVYRLYTRDGGTTWMGVTEGQAMA